MVIKVQIRKISWFYYSFNNGNMLIKRVISYLSIGCIDEFSAFAFKINFSNQTKHQSDQIPIQPSNKWKWYSIFWNFENCISMMFGLCQLPLRARFKYTLFWWCIYLLLKLLCQMPRPTVGSVVLSYHRLMCANVWLSNFMPWILVRFVCFQLIHSTAQHSIASSASNDDSGDKVVCKM